MFHVISSIDQFHLLLTLFSMFFTEGYLHMVGGYIFLWILLAIYFDNIIPINGVRKSLLYFLRPGYYTSKGGNEKGNNEFQIPSIHSQEFSSIFHLYNKNVEDFDYIDTRCLKFSFVTKV